MANKKFYYRNKSKSSDKNLLEVRAKALENIDEKRLGMSLAELGISEQSAKLLSDNGIKSASDLVVRSEKDMYKVQGLNKRVLGEVKSALNSNGMELYREPEPSQEATKTKGKDDFAAGTDGQNKFKKPEKPDQSKKTERQDKGKRSEKSELPKQAERPEQGKRPDRTEFQKSPQGAKERTSKFGLADRREPQRPLAKPARQSEKITEPLPIELWRKVMKGGKWGFSDGFKTVIPPMYDEVFSFKDGLASVEIDGKCGYIDSQNNVVIPLDYDLAMSFSEGLAMVARGEKCGYINKQNELVLDFQYDAASPFENGEAKVKKDGKWATLTPDGKLTWI